MYTLILHGRSSIHLQKWRHLRVSVVENAYSFSSASASDMSSRDGRKGKNFTVSYLVDSLGLAKKLAESISRKVSFEDKVNPDSVLSLFRSHGFTDSQISSIIRDYPRLLTTDAEKSLGLKFKFLQSRGASSSELTEIVSTVPKILAKKEGKAISRYYDLVKEIIEADKSSKFQKLSLSLPQGSKQENKIRNVLVLRELGVPQKRLFSLLVSDCAVVCGKEKFEESVNKVVEMGFDPTSSKFVQALKVVYRTSDKTIQEKINVFKRLGFSVGDVWAMFKNCPMFLNHSEKKICQRFETLNKCGLLEDQVLSVFKKYPQCIAVSEKKIANSIETFIGLGFTRDEFVEMVKLFPPCLGLSTELVKKKTTFLVKEMNWLLKVVVSNPSILGLSMEKRIVPRCNVIKVLMSKGLLGDRGSKLSPNSSFLRSTDHDFLTRYVSNHEDKELVAELMAFFTGAHVS